MKYRGCSLEGLKPYRFPRAIVSLHTLGICCLNLASWCYVSMSLFPKIALVIGIMPFVGLQNRFNVFGSSLPLEFSVVMRLRRLVQQCVVPHQWRQNFVIVFQSLLRATRANVSPVNTTDFPSDLQDLQVVFDLLVVLVGSCQGFCVSTWLWVDCSILIPSPTTIGVKEKLLCVYI